MKVSIPEALGISVLGMAVVFVVLVFLMCITYILAAVFKSRNAKKAADAASEKEITPPATVPGDNADSAAPQPAQPAAITAAPAAEPAAVSDLSSVKPSVDSAAAKALDAPKTAGAPDRRAAQLGAGSGKYKVVIDGVDYSVDAEVTGASTAVSPGSRTAADTQRQLMAGGGSGKFKVVINGIDYEVDAEVS